MRWEFTWTRRLLQAGERQDCSGQALEAEGFEFLRGAPFFSLARSSCWTQKGRPIWGARCHLAEDMRENGLQRVSNELLSCQTEHATLPIYIYK